MHRLALRRLVPAFLVFLVSLVLPPPARSQGLVDRPKLTPVAHADHAPTAHADHAPAAHADHAPTAHAAHAPTAHATAPTTRATQVGPSCVLVDFEGGTCLMTVGSVPGSINLTFGQSWFSLIDEDGPGECPGNFANEPSPDTIAFLTTESDVAIDIDPPVRYVELFYSAAAAGLPFTVQALNTASVVVAEATGTTVGSSNDGASCFGDPTGFFCLWDVLTLEASDDVITRITFVDPVDNQVGIDNLLVCAGDPDLGACCLPDGPCVQMSGVGCNAVGGLYFPDAPCSATPCATTAVEPTTWGTLKALHRD